MTHRTEDLLAVLPRGRHAAPRDVVARSQRARLLEGVAEAVAEKGYARTAVADVIARAGVSRKTFYEHFANKEECFLAGWEFGVEVLLGATETAIDAEEDPFAGAEACARAYLRELAARPAFARTFLVEVLAAGPEALERRAAVHERFAQQLERAYDRARTAVPELDAPQAHRFRAAVGAINELVTEHVRTRGAEGLEGLLPEVLDVAFRLLTGGAAPPADG